MVQVKRYYTPETVAHCFTSDLEESFRNFNTQGEDDFEMYMTEILHPSDPRASSPMMTVAKKAEIQSLLERRTFNVIPKEDLPPDGNIIPGRFVLAVMSTEDGNIEYKARYMIGSHHDKFKDPIVHPTSTLQPQSVILLLALAEIFEFFVWNPDLSKAYLRLAEPLKSDIFIAKPIAEFELDPSKFLQLLKPLCDLFESGDLWHETFDQHHRDELGMMPLRSNPALCTVIANGILNRISGGYVNDLIRAGDIYFKKLSLKTNKTCTLSQDQTFPCRLQVFRFLAVMRTEYPGSA